MAPPVPKEKKLDSYFNDEDNLGFNKKTENNIN